MRPCLEPAIDLEQDRLAEDRRAVRLVGAERAFGDGRELIRQGRRELSADRPSRTADQDRAAPGLGCSRGERGDRPSLGDGEQHGPGRALATRGDAQRAPGQDERVALPRPVVEPEPGDREDVRRRRVEDERVLELDRADRPALRAEPALARDRLAVETRERPRDLAVRAPRGSRWIAQILSITCLTTV